MTLILKQSTAVNIPVGPFVDATDGKTSETGITGLKVRLAKAGAAQAGKSTATGGTHDQRGYYTVALSTTDTNTLGHLVATATSSAALPVRHEMQVIPGDIYDAMYGSGPLLTAGLSTATVALNNVEPDVTAILADTNELQSDNIPGTLSTIDGKIDTIDTNVDSVLQLATGGAIFEKVLTESYAADGSEMTVAQALYLIQQKIGDFAISGTTVTVRELDGSTTAATYTLDSASAPTSSTRSG